MRIVGTNYEVFESFIYGGTINRNSSRQLKFEYFDHSSGEQIRTLKSGRGVSAIAIGKVGEVARYIVQSVDGSQWYLRTGHRRDFEFVLRGYTLPVVKTTANLLEAIFRSRALMNIYPLITWVESRGDEWKFEFLGQTWVGGGYREKGANYVWASRLAYANNIEDAFERLAPYTARGNFNAIRQGDLWFIPHNVLPNEFIEEDEKSKEWMVSRMNPNSGYNFHYPTNWAVQRGFQPFYKSRHSFTDVGYGYETYVAGYVRHPEHSPVKLPVHEGGKWYRILENSAEESFSQRVGSRAGHD